MSHDPDDDTKELTAPPAPAPPRVVARGGPPAAPLPARPARHSPASEWQSQASQWQSQASEWQPHTGPWQEARYGSSALVLMGAIVLLVFGLLITLVGVVGLIAGVFAAAVIGDLLTDQLAAAFGLDTLTVAVLVAFGFVLLVGVTHLFSAVGIFMHRGWGRAVGVLLATFGTLAGGLGVALVAQDVLPGQQLERALVVPGIIATGYGLTLFALLVGSNHFRPRRPRRGGWV